MNRNIRSLLTAVSGATLLALAGQAGAAGAKDAVSIDKHAVDHQCSAASADHVSASEARRQAYDYMASLGYTKSGVGSARVHDITLDGDTFVARVAYSNGGRTLANKAVLYINAHTAMVSEEPPKDDDVSVATNR